MIIYNGKNSFKDFDLYVASKDIPIAERKVVTETVPHMSGLWDFSFHDGQDEYEAVTLIYNFDVIADTKQELNAQKNALTAWAHSRGDNLLYDTDISTEYFYKVYQAQAKWSEDDLQGSFTIEFLCYPFMLGIYRERYGYDEIYETVFELNINEKALISNRQIFGRVKVKAKHSAIDEFVEFYGREKDQHFMFFEGEHDFIIEQGETAFDVIFNGDLEVDVAYYGEAL